MKSFIPLLLALFVSIGHASDPKIPRVAATDSDAIRKLLGQRAVVFGNVQRTNDYKGKLTFINFPGQKFSVVVFAKNYDRFEKPPAELLRGKQIEIIGIIAEYKENLQIVLESPEQLIKVEDLPAEEAPEKPNPNPGVPGQVPEKPKRPSEETPCDAPKVIDPGQFFGE